MKKKISKLILVFLMAIGVIFSIMNITQQESTAAMKEELLHYYGEGNDFIYWCDGEGQGCYTVTPDPSPK